MQPSKITRGYNSYITLIAREIKAVLYKLPVPEKVFLYIFFLLHIVLFD